MNDEVIKILMEALEYYANPNSWELSGHQGQFSWHSTIKNDIILTDTLDQGGGVDYAGRHAKNAIREAKALIEQSSNQKRKK